MLFLRHDKRIGSCRRPVHDAILPSWHRSSSANKPKSVGPDCRCAKRSFFWDHGRQSDNELIMSASVLESSIIPPNCRELRHEKQVGLSRRAAPRRRHVLKSAKTCFRNRRCTIPCAFCDISSIGATAVRRLSHYLKRPRADHRAGQHRSSLRGRTPQRQGSLCSIYRRASTSGVTPSPGRRRMHRYSFEVLTQEQAVHSPRSE